MEIGDKIKRMRIEKGLTQEELANRCELSKGFISQLENDLTSPSIATLIDILEILGTNLKEFFSDDRDEKITYTYEDMFETENDCSVKITIKGKDDLTTYTNTFSKAKFHYIPVYGLYADYENKVILESRYENYKKMVME